MTVLRTPLLQWFWLAIVAVILFNLSVLARLFLFPPSAQYSSALIVHLGNALGWSLGALLCARLLSRAQTKPDAQPLAVYHRLPLWISVAYLLNGVGEAVSALYYWQHAALIPWWVQSLFLLQYPCLLVAIWSLPGHTVSRSRDLRVLLDSLLLMTTIVAWSWYILVGPDLLSEHFAPLMRILDLAYLSADLILFLCLFRLFSGLYSSTMRAVRYLLFAGIVAIIPAASINILSHVQPVSAQLWITVSESAGYCFIAIAVQMIGLPARTSGTGSSALHTPSSHNKVDLFSWWQLLLPYALVPTVLFLMLWLWFTDRQSVLAQGVYLTGFIVIVQLLARQVMALREALVTNKRLQSAHEVLRLKQQALGQVNEQLGEANQRLELQARELADAYERQKQINELKDQFMLHVSHEFRTPLTAVHGYLSLLYEQKDELDSSVSTLFIEQALDGTEELNAMISTVQDALESEAVLQPPRREKNLLLPIIHEALSHFEEEVRQLYPLDLVVPEQIAVYADKQLLGQILQNLLSNVFKYCPPQTAVQIGARLIEAKPEPAGMQAEQVSIWVQDSGPGIPISEMPLLFDRFIRLKRDMTGAVRGMGLGLYICKRLTEAMHGHIWIESSGIAGEGCRVCLMLPAPRA